MAWTPKKEKQRFRSHEAPVESLELSADDTSSLGTTSDGLPHGPEKIEASSFPVKRIPGGAAPGGALSPKDVVVAADRCR